MPYISRTRRSLYDNYEMHPPDTAGDLNYVVSRLIARYTEYRGLSYTTITEVRGALMGAMHEYDRLIADPYEDQKMTDNGSVWGKLA